MRALWEGRRCAGDELSCAVRVPWKGGEGGSCESERDNGEEAARGGRKEWAVLAGNCQGNRNHIVRNTEVLLPAGPGREISVRLCPSYGENMGDFYRTDFA